MKTKEDQLQNKRQQITEQAGCPMIRVTTDDTDCVLPYSYLMRAESRMTIIKSQPFGRPLP
jgi:hypothetical protein